MPEIKRISLCLCLALFFLSCGSTGSDSGSSEFLGDGSAGYSVAPFGPLTSSRPRSPAPASVADPENAWKLLGALSGSYSLTITRIESDCGRGPDIPTYDTSQEELGSGPYETIYQLPEQERTFYVTVTQRDNSIGFELGEGVVFANWSRDTGRLTDVKRMGAEGTTSYLDGFAVEVESGAGRILRISGESAWTFEDKAYEIGERCGGRTRWQATRYLEAPSLPKDRDFHVVLRWPVQSEADLDLRLRSESQSANFVQSSGGCYVLHSVGSVAGADATEWDFVAPNSATGLPYHEEIVRCASAAYGLWVISVDNLGPEVAQEYEIEVFAGAGVNTGGSLERSFGALQGNVAAHSSSAHAFVLLPPTSGTNMYGGIFSVGPRDPEVVVAVRPRGPVTSTYLEFYKAAYQGLRFDEFLDALGI